MLQSEVILCQLQTLIGMCAIELHCKNAFLVKIIAFINILFSRIFLLRFYGSPPLPRFRPPPPPGGGQRAGRLSKGVEITEVAADSGSENEVLDNNLGMKHSL